MANGLVITGVQEAIAKVTTVEDEVPGEVEVAFYEALTPVQNETASYPSQPPSMRQLVGKMKSGRGYKRTGLYGKTQYIGVQRMGPTIVGYLDFPQPHSIFLRGTADGSYPGAWMHLGIWRTLKSIADEYTPRVIDVLDRRVSAFVKRIMGD